MVRETGGRNAEGNGGVGPLQWEVGTGLRVRGGGDEETARNDCGNYGYI